MSDKVSAEKAAVTNSTALTRLNMIVLLTFILLMLKDLPSVKLGMPEKQCFKVLGDKTKLGDSPLSGNPEKVVSKLQSEVPQSEFFGY